MQNASDPWEHTRCLKIGDKWISGFFFSCEIQTDEAVFRGETAIMRMRWKRDNRGVENEIIGALKTEIEPPILKFLYTFKYFRRYFSNPPCKYETYKIHLPFSILLSALSTLTLKLILQFDRCNFHFTPTETRAAFFPSLPNDSQNHYFSGISHRVQVQTLAP